MDSEVTDDVLSLKLEKHNGAVRLQRHFHTHFKKAQQSQDGCCTHVHRDLTLTSLLSHVVLVRPDVRQQTGGTHQLLIYANHVDLLRDDVSIMRKKHISTIRCQ